jgi:hypothetical protein
MKGFVGTLDRIIPGLNLLLELMTELYRSEVRCGIFGQNYTGVSGVVETVDGIILD